MSEQPGLRDAAILIVDDEEANVRLLARILTRAGFTRVITTCDPRDVSRRFAEISPDMIVLDIRMPALDGFAVLAQLRERVAPTDYLPVLAITGDTSPENRQAVIMAGAKDFLEKPFQPSEVVVRVENLLTTRLLHRSLQEQNEQLERKVQARTADLEMALAAAEAASRAKSRFLATMSHELRTPLNAVIGFSQHLQRNTAGNLSTQDLSFLERIRKNGAHLLHVISDVLDLSRIEAGGMPVEHERVSVELVLRDVIDEVASTYAMAQKPVALRVAIPTALPAITTDEAKLRRVLTNLIGNAAKFTERGHILVGVEPGAGGLPERIDVIDTGMGIAKEKLESIFNNFEQADNGTQRRFDGTGLGLSISRTLCQLLGYRLNVVSELGAGSAFSIVLDPNAVTPASYAELANSYELAIVDGG